MSPEEIADRRLYEERYCARSGSRRKIGNQRIAIVSVRRPHALCIGAGELTTAVVLVSLVLVRVNARALDVGGTFPELARIPLLRRFLGFEATRAVQDSRPNLPSRQGHWGPGDSGCGRIPLSKSEGGKRRW